MPQPPQPQPAERQTNVPVGAIAAGAAAVALAPPASSPVAPAVGAGVLSATAAAAAVTGTLAGIKVLFSKRRRALRASLMKMLDEEYPGRPLAEKRAAAVREADLEGEFQDKALVRWREGLEKAMQLETAEERRAAITALLAREQHYERLRDEALRARAVADIERAILHEVSPEGAFWRLSADVREHTPDCVAMANHFWPWEVLDRIHPPLHHGCPCGLYSLRDAIAAGWMTAADIPDTADAVERSKRILAAFPTLRKEIAESIFHPELHPRDRYGKWAEKLGHEIAPLTPRQRRRLGRGRWVDIGGRHMHVPEAADWRTKDGVYRSPPGSTLVYRGSELVDAPGGPSAHGLARPALSTEPASADVAKAADAERARRAESAAERLDAVLAGLRSPEEELPGMGPEHRDALHAMGFHQTWRARTAPRGNTRTTHEEWRHPDTHDVLRLRVDHRGTIVGVDHRIEEPLVTHELDRPAADWTDHRADMNARAEELSRRYGTPTTLTAFDVDEGLSDTAGLRAWDGSVTIGPDAPFAIALASGWRDDHPGEPLPDDMAADLWYTHQVSEHEILHTLNPTQPQDYFAESGRQIEEALTEELSHVLAVERLRRQGQEDVLRWYRDNRFTVHAMGTYWMERMNLLDVLNRAGVAPDDRRAEIERLKMDVHPADRVDELVRMIQAGPRPFKVRGDDGARAYVESTMAQTRQDVISGPYGIAPDLGGLGDGPTPERTTVGGVSVAVGDNVRVRFPGGSGRGRIMEVDEGLAWARIEDGGLVRVGPGAIEEVMPPDRIEDVGIHVGGEVGYGDGESATVERILKAWPEDWLVEARDAEGRVVLLRGGRGKLTEAVFEEEKHPRGRIGRWIRKFGLPSYEVGGAVRDPLLGKEPKDIDFMVRAHPEEIARRVRETGGVAQELRVRDRLVGVRAFHPDLPPEGVELAPPRVEVSTGSGRHDFEIRPHSEPQSEGALLADAHRRDFTVNALYRDEQGVVHDPTGHGMEDIRQRQLRTTHEDSFRDDPLRILRGARFAAQHGLTIEPETMEQMKRHSGAVSALTQRGVSGTVASELNKLLMSDDPARGLRILRDSGALETLIPEFGPSIGFDQESKYHDQPLDEHVFTAIQRAAEAGAPLQVRLALLFHDIGKPESAWRGEDGRLHYYANEELGKEDHADIGGRVVREVLRRLNYDGETVRTVGKLVDNHMLATGKPRAAKVRRLRSELGDSLLNDLVAHRRADKGGRMDLEGLDALEQMATASRMAGDPVQIGDLAVNGRDLIDAGIAEGPKIGETLRALLHQVLGNPRLNERERLLRMARGMHSKMHQDTPESFWARMRDIHGPDVGGPTVEPVLVDPASKRRIVYDVGTPPPVGGWTSEQLQTVAETMAEALGRYPILAQGNKPLTRVVRTSEDFDVAMLMPETAPMAVLTAPDWDEQFLVVNDRFPDSLDSLNATVTLSPATRRGVEGTTWHEIGHLLAFASGVDPAEGGEYDRGASYMQTFHEYGLSPPLLMDISPYAGSSPMESFAELSAMWHLMPEALEPSLREGADRLFGGLAKLARDEEVAAT